MRFPAFWLAAGFAGGVLLAHLTIPARWFAAFFTVALPFLWAFRGRKPFLPITLLLAASLGFLYAHAGRARFPHAIESWAGGGLVSLEGVVRTPPEIETNGRKVTVSFVLSSRNLMKREGDRRQFFESSGDVQVFCYQPAATVDFGDRVRLWGELEKARPVSNPGEFDYGRYLAQRNISVIFRGYGARCLRRMGPNEAPLFLKLIYGWRRWIAERIDLLYGDPDAVVLFKALTVGIRKGLRPELRDEFMKTGTTHLLAISGLNITLAAGSFYFLLLVLKVPQRLAAALALIVVFGYVFVAGLGIPVQRAGWMAGAAFFGLLLERERSALNLFFIAFLILIVTDTQNLANLSFQLSFLSVLSLILFLPRRGDLAEWRASFLDSLAVLTGTFPLVVYHFNVFSPVSVLANLGAIPLFHLALLTLMVSLALGTIPLLGTILVSVAMGFLKGGLAWIHLLGGFDKGYYYLASPGLAQLGLYYTALTSILVLRRLRVPVARWLTPLAWSVFLAVTLSFFWPRNAPFFRLTLLSAGSNELAHLEVHPRIHWLINAGRGFPSDQGQWILSPYLRSKGVKRLSGILVTDFYKRHTGGLATVLRNFSADYFLYPSRAAKDHLSFHELSKKGIQALPLGEGGRVRMRQGGEIEVLAQAKGQMALLISYPPWDFLFLPSLDPEVLERLLPQRDRLLEVDAVLLPALAEAPAAPLEKLFNWVAPEVVVLPKKNPEIEGFLHDRDIALLDLAGHGALTFSLTQPPKGGQTGVLEISSVLKGPLGRDLIDNGKASVL